MIAVANVNHSLNYLRSYFWSRLGSFMGYMQFKKKYQTSIIIMYVECKWMTERVCENRSRWNWSMSSLWKKCVNVNLHLFH